MSTILESLELVLNMLYYHNRESDNMIYPSIDKLLNDVGSKYLLVNLVSKRANELSEKQNYQTKETEYTSAKNIGRALEEVSKNLIHLK